jgi:hypothetical protein
MLHENRRFIAFAAIGSAAMGAALEFGQLYSPGRAFEYADMLANALGVGFGVVVGLPIRTWFAMYHSPGLEPMELRTRTREFTRHEMQPHRIR